MSELRLRQAVRAIVLDPDDRILLVRFEFPPAGPGLARRVVWATPGGGLEDGESDGAGIRRELLEEVGYDLPRDPGPVVWTRTHVVPLAGGRFDGQRERYYVVRTPRFAPAPRLDPEELEREHVYGMRWWTPEELDAADVELAPRRLPELLRELLAVGPPSAPVDAGV